MLSQTAYTYYEVDQVEVNKVLKQARKYSKMIDPKEIVQGKEYLHDVLCQSCGHIPINLNIKECVTCKSIICDKCYLYQTRKLDDALLDCHTECTNTTSIQSIAAFPRCPICTNNLKRLKIDGKKVQTAIQNMTFKHTCSS